MVGAHVTGLCRKKKRDEKRGLSWMRKMPPPPGPPHIYSRSAEKSPMLTTPISLPPLPPTPRLRRWLGFGSPVCCTQTYYSYARVRLRYIYCTTGEAGGRTGGEEQEKHPRCVRIDPTTFFLIYSASFLILPFAFSFSTHTFSFSPSRVVKQDMIYTRWVKSLASLEFFSYLTFSFLFFFFFFFFTKSTLLFPLSLCATEANFAYLLENNDFHSNDISPLSVGWHCALHSGLHLEQLHISNFFGYSQASSPLVDDVNFCNFLRRKSVIRMHYIWKIYKTTKIFIIDSPQSPL